MLLHTAHTASSALSCVGGRIVLSLGDVLIQESNPRQTHNLTVTEPRHKLLDYPLILIRSGSLTAVLKSILIKNSIKSPDLSYVFEKLTKINKN